MSHTLYTASVQRVQRCELAVPGSNPEMFEKAMKSGADFIFLDLEDAVAPDDKLRARKNIIEAIKHNGMNINNNTINSNNNNKTFNLQVFLNEDCKDAMNISDFMS